MGGLIRLAQLIIAMVKQSLSLATANNGGLET